MARTARLSGHNGTAASWPGNVGVTSGEFAYFDQACFKSISETGGTYSFDSELVLGGAHIQFDSEVTFDAGVDFDDNVEIDGGSAVTHKSLSIGQYVDTSIAGSLNVSGGTATIGDSPSDTLTVNSSQTYNGGEAHNGVEAHIGIEVHEGAETHTGAVDFTGNVAIDGGTSGVHKTLTGGAYVDTTWHGSTTFAGPTTYSGNETHSGTESHSGDITNGGALTQSGRFSQVYAIITASGTTIPVATRNVAVSSSSGGYVLLATGWLSGQTLSITNISSNALEIRVPSGSRLCGLSAAISVLEFAWVDIMYDGTSYLISRSYHASS